MAQEYTNKCQKERNTHIETQYMYWVVAWRKQNSSEIIGQNRRVLREIKFYDKHQQQERKQLENKY